ncbi:MAG TPA: ATP-dependent sacrificial sulfur transferase LarE [Lachnospiraceae bacterium]|nr:ATP-dependent sacrificial sulfur transferase LarE [Lachnospiraceae bacterium]
MNEVYEERKEALLHRIREYAAEDVAVAFSGGTDSSLLLKLACEAAKETGKRVLAVTMKTRLHPAAELIEAARAAADMGAEHRTIQVDELAEAGILDNPRDRCYRCKRLLFAKLCSLAKDMGIRQILEGTNEDDLHVYRPGIRALEELGITSPLAEAGFTKTQVRLLAAEYGLASADKPASPCMATRFPYGTRLSYEEMDRAALGEAYLRGLGFYNVRLRVHGEIVRLEVDAEAFSEIFARRQEIIARMKELGYRYITLDLEGFRSGSMDIRGITRMVSCGPFR